MDLNIIFFIDEIQIHKKISNKKYLEGDHSKITFVDLVLGLMKVPNVDIYITGSNSKKYLSSDVLTHFEIAAMK